MKRVAPLLTLLTLFATDASAQAPAATQGQVQGQALLDDKLPDGTVTVRVVRGSMDKPVVGVSVEVNAVGETARALTARTNSEGRATIPSLKAGGTYRARAKVNDAMVESEPFAAPARGGVRLLLTAAAGGSGPGGAAAAAAPAEAPPAEAGDSTPSGGAVPNPHGGGEGAPGMAGDDGGDPNIPPMMRDPRRISGQPRPEQKDPAGRLTVRTVQGKFKSSEAGLTSDFPRGAPVHLVGYHADGKVSVQTGKVGDEGRVEFDRLERGGTAYYLLSLFQRQNGVDRVVSQPVRMPPEVGMRLMLAGLAPDAAEPGADDLPKLEQPALQPSAGTVLVRLQVSPDKREAVDKAKEFELVDAATGAVVARAPVRPFSPSPQDVTSQVLQVKGEEMKLGANEIGIGVYRPSFNAGLPAVNLELRDAETAAVVSKAATDTRGFYVFRGLKLAPKQKLVAVSIVHGKDVSSQPFVLDPGSSLGFAMAVDWADGELEGKFESVAGGPDKVYFARITLGTRPYLTAPFQLTDKLGAALNILVYPDVLFGFHGGAVVEDDKLWFQLRLLFQNPGQTPYVPPSGELFIPLPRGLVGISVPEEAAAKVKIVTDEGLIIKGALAPGMTDVTVDFALPTKNGGVQVDWDLPLGLARGQLMLEESRGMLLTGVPADLRPRSQSLENGKSYKVLDNIQIEAGKRLSFGVKNLPEHSAWAARLRWLAGITAVGLMGWALVSTLARRRVRVSAGERALAARRSVLLDELVRLESNQRKGRLEDSEYQERRGELMRELETLFNKLADKRKTK